MAPGLNTTQTPLVIVAVVMVTLLMSQELTALSMWRTMLRDFRLHKFARELEKYKMTSMFEAHNITVYLPSSVAYFRFDANYYGIKDRDPEKWREIVGYSTQNGTVRINDLPVNGKIQSRLLATLYLYVNTFYVNEGVVTTINGARIIHPDIECDNGILHIIDAVIYPIGTHQTVAEYLYHPELTNLAFVAITVASPVVVPEIKAQTNSSKRLFTSFSPNDSYLYPMAEYGQDRLYANFTLLKEVYKAHLIEDEAFFIPYTLHNLPDKASMQGEMTFYRRGGSVYMANGRVHARIVQPNIPTINGVIHVIDNLVYYVYQNALQITATRGDTQMWSQLLQGLTPELKEVISSKMVTMFVPTDEAFGKTPLYFQSELMKKENRIDRSDLDEIMFGHIIIDSSISPAHLEDGQKLTTMNDQSLTVVRSGKDIYLESSTGRVRAKVEVQDIGVTNGVVHLISNILFADKFTIWDALGDIPQLSEIHTLIVNNFHDLRATLNGDATSEPITVFLPNNDVINRATDFLNSMLLKKSNDLLQVLKGHFLSGQYSSSHIIGSKSHMTFSDKAIQLSRDPETGAITVSGAHVTSHVKVSDIQCSNGVIHVIDDILHIPTRHVLGEVKRRSEVSYMYAFLTNINDKRFALNSTNDNYTLFIPNNESFNYLPWDTIEQLLKNLEWTKGVLRAHIVRGELRPLEQIPSEKEGLVAYKNQIYIHRVNGKVYVINNNMRAEVIHSNIPATNGWIHIVDRVLTVPYTTVGDVLKSRPEVRSFHKLVAGLPEYQEILSSSMRQVTLFIPSTRYIQSLKPRQWDRIRKSKDIIQTLFYGHVVPNMRIDEEFLMKYKENEYRSRTTYNMTFRISRVGSDTFVDVGFDLQRLHLIGQTWGCSDGVIYAIDGFLNYSPFSVLERLKREPGLSRSFDHMSRLVSPSELELFNNPDLSFTFLMPDDLAFDYYTFNERLHLHALPMDQQKRIFWRHVFNGSIVYYEDLKSGHDTSILPRDVSINVTDQAVTLRYHDITSRIKDWNLITSNGVIHILQKLLYDTKNEDVQNDSNSTPGPRSPTTRGPAQGGGRTGSITDKNGSGNILHFRLTAACALVCVVLNVLCLL